jgi:hypothetical protein
VTTAEPCATCLLNQADTTLDDALAALAENHQLAVAGLLDNLAAVLGQLRAALPAGEVQLPAAGVVTGVPPG